MFKKFSFYTMMAAASLFAVSCSDDEEEEKVPVDELEADEVRIVADITADGIEAADVFHLAGSFADEEWQENGSYILAKRDDGTYYLDITADDVANGTTLEFKVQRNGVWTYVEKDAACAEIGNRVIEIADNLGEEVAIEVVAFRNTGACPD